jgi:hypothetical protein
LTAASAISRFFDGFVRVTSRCSKCHRYLAGFVLCRTKPLVVAVTPVRGDESKGDAVEGLLDYVAALSFTVAGLLADRGFYNGASIERLDAVAPVALPVIRRGKQMAKELDRRCRTGRST